MKDQEKVRKFMVRLSLSPEKYLVYLDFITVKNAWEFGFGQKKTNTSGEEEIEVAFSSDGEKTKKEAEESLKRFLQLASIERRAFDGRNSLEDQIIVKVIKTLQRETFADIGKIINNGVLAK